MPKIKRFKNPQKSVQSLPASQHIVQPVPTMGSSSPLDTRQEVTSRLASSFQGTRYQDPSLQATPQSTHSFSATKQRTPSFQFARKQVPSFQATSPPTPSFQATSLPTPSFQGTRFQAPSFQATSQPSSSTHVMSQTPSVSLTPPQEPFNKRKRQSTHHWTVDAIDSQGNTKKLKVKKTEVLNLPRGERIVVPFDFLDPIDEAQGVLAGFCGILASDCSIFPISFDKWPDMPQSYFNDCFDNIIKPHFHFMTTEDIARLYAYRSMEKKWAGNRQALWKEFNDPLKTKDEIRNNVPEGIARDQWASFVNYRLRDDTQRMCKRNAENRKKQTVPHTGGSKPNSRRRAEMFAETGRRPGRAELYLATHKKQDGSYVNEEAKEICEKIQLAVSQSTMNESEISPNDAVGKVLGKEHTGRVRCLGLGATPSTHFKQTKPRVYGIRIPSDDAGCSSFGCQDKYNQLLDTLKAYMIMKEGSIPEQFAGIFGSPPTTPSDAASC